MVSDVNRDQYVMLSWPIGTFDEKSFENNKIINHLSSIYFVLVMVKLHYKRKLGT